VVGIVLGLAVALVCYRCCVRRQPRPLPSPIAVEAKLEMPSTGAPQVPSTPPTAV
jgi:hypothetical protein